MDLKIREFQTALEKYVDNTDIPSEVKRIIIADLLRKVEEKANTDIVAQFAERESKKVSEEDKKDEQ